MIKERKGKWYVVGKGRPYSTKAEAEQALGVSVDTPPVEEFNKPEKMPETRHYVSILEAIEAEEE